MVRNAGKFGKPRRGGGKHFSRNLQPLESGGADKEGMWDEEGEDSDEEEDSDKEESSDDEDGPSTAAAAAGSSSAAPTGALNERFASTSLGNDEPVPASRADRKAAKKKAPAKKDDDESEEDEDDLVNPNRAAPKAGKASDIGKAPAPMSRRDREAAEKKAAQERYMKLHLAGKTDQAKADMARLAQIKAQREAAAATRKAEADAKAKEQAEKVAASGRKNKR